MNTETMNKIRQIKADKTACRTHLEFDGIVIKSYEHGWILNIGSEESRYYSDLPGLFKKLFSIKLSRKRLNELQQLESLLKTVYSEVYNIAHRLEEKFTNKMS